MIKAIAIDDEPPALRVLENFCSRVGFISLQNVFTAPEEALRYLRKYPVDLVFIDIRMKGISGIEMAKSMPQNSKVIFTTGHSQYAVESYNLNAVDYLLKPFSFDRFLQAITKVDELLRMIGNSVEVETGYFFIRADYSLIKINFSEIVFIEGLDDYLKIHLDNKKPVVARMTLKSIMGKLPGKDFVRIHRSYIIPLARIENLRNRTIQIAGEEIPIGKSYEEAFNLRFSEK